MSFSVSCACEFSRHESTPPPLPRILLEQVVEQYEQAGLVARVDGNQDVEAVFRDVVSGLRPVQEKEVLDANRLAVEAVCAGDLSAFAEVGAVLGDASRLLRKKSWPPGLCWVLFFI